MRKMDSSSELTIVIYHRPCSDPLECMTDLRIKSILVEEIYCTKYLCYQCVSYCQSIIIFRINSQQSMIVSLNSVSLSSVAICLV